MKSQNSWKTIIKNATSIDLVNFLLTNEFKNN